MSIALITMCRRRLDVSHGELLVAIELADAANDDGEGISVGVERIADRSRQDSRTVQRQLKRLREVGWLQIVEAGGMVGGRGRATRYCINSTWVKGDSLPGFPDYTPKYQSPVKGDNMTPLPTERVTNSTERVTNQPLKGDTAVSPDPSTHIPSDAHARANPTGSRGAEPDPKRRGKVVNLPTAETIEAREERNRQLRANWLSRISGTLFGLAGFYGAAHADLGKPKPTGWDDLKPQPREILPPICRALAERAFAMVTDIPPRPHSVVEAMIEQELVSELKRFSDPTPAERASAGLTT